MSIASEHNEWLRLLDISGPFLSLPVLIRVFPQGLDSLDGGVVKNVRAAFDEWENSHDDRAIHHAWIRWVLGTVLELPADLLTDEIPSSLVVRVPEHHETLRPDLLLANPDDRAGAGMPRLLITILPPGCRLDRSLPGSRWPAPPGSRMMELLHATGVRLGLVTNGEQWMLVDAPQGETTGFISWYASLWTEERDTLRAFRSLLGRRRWFGVPDKDTLEAMLAESAADQHDVTDQLGAQVRRAVEILVQEVDRVDKDRGRALLEGIDEKGLYESALTVMMRLVFLLSVEENELLPTNALYDWSYAVSTLRAQLNELADETGEDVLGERYDAWSRLLATFRAVHGGVEHDSMRLPAYGGALFDPDRFPFLEGRPLGTSWRTTPADPLPVSNRAVLHLLEALQVLQVKVPGGGVEARNLSFRALDIEQIGHVYESLLDHTAKRAEEPVLGLAGSKEPEVALGRLDELAARGQTALVAYLKDATGKTEKSLVRALAMAELDVQRLRAACDNEEVLLQRVLPFAGLLRVDPSGYPVVVTPGSVYVTRGSDRRSTGTHYTPRSLTEPIVRYTLEPLVYDGPAEGKSRDEWRLRPARELLNLKICDMAMGSGAFLVQVCRYLAERLVEAWAEVEAENPGRVVVTPEGELAGGEVHERPIPREPEERIAVARRIVADRCIYGVDVNPMAVEMGKLSLWLVTLQRDRPFTFLDHALRCGDSLLGVDLEQLSDWSLERRHTRQLVWFDELMRAELVRALALRRRIESMQDVSVADTEEKARLLAEADEAMALVKLGADLLAGAALADKREQKAVRDALLWRFQLEVSTLQDRRGAAYQPHVLEEDLERRAELRAEADRLLGGRRPFHWPLEFPEVFVDGDALSTPIGFDALVGNPPFVNGKRITTMLGTEYRDYLVEHLSAGKRGSADLCAYFFLRGAQLLRANGDFGMLATNTIAQGDTREVGLEQLVERGATILRAVPSRKWPGEANLEIAEVWIRKGTWNGSYLLSDSAVGGVTPFLSAPGDITGNPYRLTANAGKSFNGSYILGMGFVLTPDEAQWLIDTDPRNREVLYPYLNGEDLNSRPDQSASRWVINFHDWPIERAQMYPDCWRIVEERVRPERQRRKEDSTYALRKPLPERYWQYADKRPALYATIACMERVLSVAATSRTLAFAFMPSSIVFSHATYVFALGKWSEFSLLQSCFHDVWAWEYASSMKKDLRYTPSDVFETFPFPLLTGSMDSVGESYYHQRQAIMGNRNQGLTKTFKLLNDPSELDPDIVTLRKLQSEVDNSVNAAYGWADLELDHGFHESKQGIRFTISAAARREVLGRLLTLNHERHAEEINQGLHENGASGTAQRKAKGIPTTTPLFGEEAS